MPNAVVLLSGGIDSAALLFGNPRPKLALAVNYGQPHAIELRYAARLAEIRDVPFHVVDAPVIPLIDDVVFAGRNAILLSIAAAVSMQHRIGRVKIGCNATDAGRFADCRKEFIASMHAAMLRAYGVGIIAPLLGLEKAEVVRLAKERGVLLDQTWSCYGAGPEPCGVCLACRVRAEAGA